MSEEDLVKKILIDLIEVSTLVNTINIKVSTLFLSKEFLENMELCRKLVEWGTSFLSELKEFLREKIVEFEKFVEKPLRETRISELVRESRDEREKKLFGEEET